MTVQTLLALSAAAASALYFLGRMVRDLRSAVRPAASACSGCPSGGCPVARMR